MTDVLFDRFWKLQIGGILIDGTQEDRCPLDIDFSVEKSTTREPNRVAISVYNLNPSHRESLRESSSTGIILEAGYKETEISVIFNGDLRGGAESEKDGTRFVTRIEGNDGGTSYRDNEIHRSFAPDTAVIDVLRAAVDALQIGRGNLAEISSLSLTNGGSVYSNGTALNGKAKDAIDRIVRSCGYRWSIQDGVFQLRERGRPVRGTAVRLSEANGMVGSPKRTKTQNGRQTAVEVKSLIRPGLYPGRIIDLESVEINGGFYVSNIRYNGSTFTNDWHASMVLKDY